MQLLTDNQARPCHATTAKGSVPSVAPDRGSTRAASSTGDDRLKLADFSIFHRNQSMASSGQFAIVGRHD